MSISLEKMLTVIIPTHERRGYLKRSLLYWGAFNLRVIVVDSSTNAYMGMLPDNIEYLHVANSIFSKKVYQAITMVNTPFMTLCPDDDFQTEIGLRSCVKFLNANPMYSAARGQQVVFFQDLDVVRLNKLYQKEHHIDASEKDVIERVEKSFEKYVLWLWAVHRTDVMENIFLKYANIRSGNLVELGICLGSISSGFHVELPVLYQFREVLENSWGRRACGLSQLENSDKHIEEMKEWKNKSIVLIQELSGLNFNDSEEVYQVMRISYNKNNTEHMVTKLIRGVKLLLSSPKEFVMRTYCFVKGKHYREQGVLECEYEWENSESQKSWEKCKQVLGS